MSKQGVSKTKQARETIANSLNRWNAEKVQKEILHRNDSGKNLSQKIVNEEKKSLLNAARRYFGSWKLAVESCGISYESVRLKDSSEIWTKDSLKKYIIQNAPGYKLVGDVSGANKKIKLECPNGHIYEPKLSHFVNSGTRCMDCWKYSKNKFSYESVKKEFEDRGFILLEKKYKNNYTPMKFICTCGNEGKISLAVIKRGSSCNECGNRKSSEKQRLSYSYVKKVFQKNGCALLEETFINSHQKLKYVCSCGRKSLTTFTNFSYRKRCNECSKKRRIGPNHYKWNPNISHSERIVRRSFPEYQYWRNEVFERDDYMCKCCGIRGCELNAHHLDGYDWCKDKRLDVTNGVTLCKECHNNFHNKYGRGGNTRQQYEEWLPVRQVELSEVGNRSTTEPNAI